MAYSSILSALLLLPVVGAAPRRASRWSPAIERTEFPPPAGRL